MNLVGEKFGKLTVSSVGANGWTWVCRCDCGVVKLQTTSALRLGKSRSCGCSKGAAISARKLRHGKSKTPEFRIWAGMHHRCIDTLPKNARVYLDKGIRVCERWTGKEGFANFLQDLGPRPSPSHSIDRIDLNGNYCPENCRWADWVTQNNNRRCTRYLTHAGVTLSVAQWAVKKAVPVKRLYKRAYAGWSDSEILTTP